MLFRSAGLGKGAHISFTCETVLDWDPSRDGMLPATDKLPETPVHKLKGLDPSSITILKKARSSMGLTPASAPESKHPALSEDEILALAAKIQAKNAGVA